MGRFRTGTGRRLLIGRVGSTYNPAPVVASSPTFRSASSVNSTTGSLTITAPTGVASGDVLLLVVGGAYDIKNGSVALASPPTGWTAVQTWAYNPAFNGGLWIYTKVAGGTTSSVTVTGTNWFRMFGSMVAVSSASAVDVSSAIQQSKTTTAVTTTASNDLLLFIAAGYNIFGAGTVPTGMTQQVNAYSAVSGNGGLLIASLGLSSSGSTGTKSLTSPDPAWLSTLVAVK